jgi:ribosome biogenesis protein UTP30
MVKKVKKSSFLDLSAVQLKKALKVVSKLIKEKQDPSDLLPNEDEFINLTIEVNHLPDLSTLRVVAIPIPFPIYSKQFNSRVFLIVKDPQREMKEKIDSLNLKDLPLSKVCGISKLGKNYTQYKDRRELIREYDLFLADIRVFNMLPDRLGKYFYEKKRIPALLCLDTDMESEIRKVLSSTFLIAAKGPVFNIKVGRISMPEAEVIANIQAVVEAIPKILPGATKENIRRLDLKGELSLALPVYNFLTPYEVSSYKE